LMGALPREFLDTIRKKKGATPGEPIQSSDG